LRNVFGFKKILKRGPDYVNTSGSLTTQWIVLDKYGYQRSVRAVLLFKKLSAGKRAPNNTTSNNGKMYPEARTVRSHIKMILKPTRARKNYKYMRIFRSWDPRRNGSVTAAIKWLRENMPKPNSDFQLHVLKTKKYPRGFFGPGGIVWRHKMGQTRQRSLRCNYRMAS